MSFEVQPENLDHVDHKLDVCVPTEEEPTPSPTVTSDPDRLLVPSTSFDVGVVDTRSEHVFQLGDCTVRGDVLGVAYMSTDEPFIDPETTDQLNRRFDNTHEAQPDDFHASSKEMLSLDPKKTGPRLKVTFSPRHAGPHRGALKVKSTFADGKQETATISLSGRARDSLDIPVQPPTLVPDSATKSIEEYEAKNEGSATSLATAQAVQLATNLARGVRDAKDDSKFDREPPKTPWWVGFAEAALLAGFAGFAGAYGKGIAASVLKMGEKSDAVVFAADFAKKALDIGLKSTFEAAVTKIVGHTRPSSAAKTQGDEISSNPKTAFFATQEEACSQQIDVNATNVAKVYDATASRFGVEAAIHATNAVGHALALSAATAHRLQKSATEVEWVRGIAAANTPRVEVDDGHGGREEITRNDPRNRGRDGVLSLVASVAAPDPTRSAVTKAKLNGISQAIADDLWRRPLDQFAVPVNIRITKGYGGADGEVMRDERGHVDVLGTLPDPEDGKMVTNESALRFARPLAAHLTSKSLRDWGIARVETDDANKSQTIAPDSVKS